MLHYLNPIKILILLTFVYFLFKFDKRKKVHYWVLAVLTLNLANETLSSYLKYHGITLRFSASVYIIFHTLLWINLLGFISGRRRLAWILSGIFSIFAFCNFLWIDGEREFNAFSLILGAFLYVLFFIYDCALRLQREDMIYFSSDHYVLTAAPLLFMIGFAILFGFRSKELHNVEIFGTTLYILICYSINLFYYFLMNVYINKQPKPWTTKR